MLSIAHCKHKVKRKDKPMSRTVRTQQTGKGIKLVQLAAGLVILYGMLRSVGVVGESNPVIGLAVILVGALAFGVSKAVAWWRYG